jgi:ankyrin repeat protein
VFSMLKHQNLKAMSLLFMDPKKRRSKGVCYGLSAKYLDAFFCDDRVTLYNRLALVEKYQNKPDELLVVIQSVYDKLKEKKVEESSLRSEELTLLEIRPFFENLILQLQPNYYHEINKGVVMQNYVLNHHLSSPTQLEKTNPRQIHRSYHAKTEVELAQYFDQLKLIIKASSQKIGFIIESDEHAIALNYNREWDKWDLLNADVLEQKESVGNYHLELSSSELATRLRDSLNPILEENDFNEGIFDDDITTAIKNIDDDVVDQYRPTEFTIFKLSCFVVEVDLSLKNKLDDFSPLRFDKIVVERQNDDEVSILLLAAQAGDIDAVEAMLPHVKEIDKPRYDGKTALSMAVREGHFSMSTLLIKNEADVEQTDEKGQSLLHLAATTGHAVLIDHLVDDLNLFVDELDDNSCTPLINAILNDHYEAILRLIKHNADVNWLDDDEMSPLFYAVFVGNPKVITLLIMAGADVKHKDKNDNTVMDLAKSSDDPQLEELLFGHLSAKEDPILNAVSRQAYKDKQLKSITTLDAMPKLENLNDKKSLEEGGCNLYIPKL